MLLPFNLLSLVGSGALIVAWRKDSTAVRLKWFTCEMPFAISVDRYAALEALVMAVSI